MNIFPLLRQQSLDYEKISTIETRYFIDHFLVSEAITMIYGRASQGKTFFFLGLVKMLSKREDVSEIVYVDLDNPKSQLKKRNLHVHFKDNKKITYIHKGDMTMDKHELLELFRNGAKEKGEPYKDCIFIIDSTRDFFHNLYNDIEVRQFMQTMKDVRDAGGTVLLIHHSTKSGKVIDGSADFTKSSDNVYELKQKAKIGEVLHFTLRIEYDRDDIKHCGFSVNTQTLELEELDPDLSQMSEYEEEFVNEVKKVLEKNPKGLNKSQILEMLGYERTDVTARATLEKFIDKYWQSTKIKNQFNITLIS
jgi:archaellum biogenesis ATPase FlaH